MTKLLGICKLYPNFTHLLPHVTCLASNLRHESLNFSHPKNDFIMKLSVALKTYHYEIRG